MEGVSSLLARHQLAVKMNTCVPGLLPILFHFNPKSDQEWVSKLVGISGRRLTGRIDGVETMKLILEDAKNHFENEIRIPKRAVIQEGKSINCFYFKLTPI